MGLASSLFTTPYCLPPPAPAPALPGLGANAGPFPGPPGVAAAPPSGEVAGLAALAAAAAAATAAAAAASASGASPVLELALDHLGLGATAGAHNLLDILVKGRSGWFATAT